MPKVKRKGLRQRQKEDKARDKVRKSTTPGPDQPDGSCPTFTDRKRQSQVSLLVILYNINVV